MKTWMTVLFVLLMGSVGVALPGETSAVQLSRDQFNLIRDTADELDDLAERIDSLRKRLRAKQEELKDIYKQSSESDPNSSPLVNQVSVPATPEVDVDNRNPASESSYILYVTASWCTPCQKVKPYIEELKKKGYKVEEWGPGKVGDIFVVDFDKLTPNQRKKEFRILDDIEALPCFIKVGGSPPAELDRRSGYLSKKQFVDFYFERKTPVKK